MKIGLHSWSRQATFKEGAYDIWQFLDEAANWGFHAVELMTGKAGTVQHIPADDLETLRRIVDYARERDIVINCWSTYNDFSFVKNEAWRQANVRYIEDWCDKAAATGVPNLRFLTGYWVEGEDPKRLEQLVIEETRKVARRAEDRGVNLALENHNTIFLYADGIRQLRDAVDSRRLTTCPDPSNGFKSILSGTPDPDEIEAMYANLTQMAPHATNAHLKIIDEHASPFDLDRLIGIYADAGFAGTIQLEIVKEGTNHLDVVAPAVREQLEAAIARRQEVAA